MSHRRLIILLVGAGAFSAALPLSAHDKNVLDARDLVHCMKGRMKADQSESYREAFKMCKLQLDPSSGASSNAIAMNAADRPHLKP